MVVVAIGWQLALNRHMSKQRSSGGSTTSQYFRWCPCPRRRRRLAQPRKLKTAGPFSIAWKKLNRRSAGRNPTPGSTKERAQTVVAMEIRDPNEAGLYKRSFPSNRNPMFTPMRGTFLRI